MKLQSLLFITISALTAACGGAHAPDASASSPTSGTLSAGALDGKRFDVTLSFPGEAAQTDTLSFEAGRFESTLCTSIGFPQWTDYRATSAAGGADFEVTTHHPSGTTLVWKGRASAGGVEGRATRTRDGKTEEGTFTGSSRR